MSRRLSQEEFVSRIDKRNDNWNLITNFERTDYPITIQCKYHNWVRKEIKKSNSLITSHILCDECERVRLGNNFKNRLLEYHSSISLIGKYIDAVTDTRFKCDECGFEFDAKPNNMISDKKVKLCPNCKTNNRIKENKNITNELNKIANRHGYSLIGNFISYKDNILCKCENGHEFYKNPTNIKKGSMCIECFKNNMHLYQSKPFIETHENLSKYLINNEDAYNYSYGSKVKVYWRCPDCGEKLFRSFNAVSSNGFACKKCSDGYSYPNKFISSVLKQLKVNFKAEYSADWTDNKIYDFVIENEKLIIEMDGSFHYEDLYGAKDDVIQIDNYKNNLADKNGYKLVRINCNYNNINERYSYIKDNIINSELSVVFDLSNIDWDKCNVDGNIKVINVVLNYWNSGIKDIREISSKSDISISRVQKALKLAAKNNLIEQTSAEIKKLIREQGYKVATEKQKLMKKKNSYQVKCNETCEIFNSVADAIRKYPSAKHIYDCVNNKTKYSGTLDNGTKLSWTKVS